MKYQNLNSEYVDPNREFPTILTKIEIFKNLDKNSNFSTIFTKIEIFLNFDQNWSLFEYFD